MTMNKLEAIEARHSVRAFTDQPIAGDTLSALTAAVASVNQKSGLHIQLICQEPTVFGGLVMRQMAKNASNYLAIAGPDNSSLSERGGYYGEQLVLIAQQLGLSTHWIASYNTKKALSHVAIAPNEKLLILIAIGYGANQGKPHSSKSIEKLGATVPAGPLPAWFQAALTAVSLAPSALNRQDVHFELHNGRTVTASASNSSMGAVNLGIAKCHFEIGAADADWHWSDE